MTQNDIVAAMQSLYPNLQVGIDFTTNNNNGVGSLALWNNANGTQPTTEQLQAVLDAIQIVGYKTVQTATIANSFNVATYQTPIAYMGTTFWTDSNTQFMLMGAMAGFLAAGSAVPSGFQWWDSTGHAVGMTFAQFSGLYQATLAMFNTNFVKQKTLLAEIQAATTIAAVRAIVW